MLDIKKPVSDFHQDFLRFKNHTKTEAEMNILFISFFCELFRSASRETGTPEVVQIITSSFMQSLYNFGKTQGNAESIEKLVASGT
jgi:hypothetical protein